MNDQKHFDYASRLRVIARLLRLAANLAIQFELLPHRQSQWYNELRAAEEKIHCLIEERELVTNQHEGKASGRTSPSLIK